MLAQLLTAVPVQVVAQEESPNLLGDDFFAWVVLAIGGALLVGNVLALVRPPDRSRARRGDLDQAPVARSVTMAVVGGIATIWALATLFS